MNPVQANRRTFLKRSGIGSVALSSLLAGEVLISLTEAASCTPSRPTVRTLWRWASKGVAGVRLQTLKIGGRTYTSRPAIERFLLRLNDDPSQLD